MPPRGWNVAEAAARAIRRAAALRDLPPPVRLQAAAFFLRARFGFSAAGAASAAGFFAARVRLALALPAAGASAGDGGGNRAVDQLHQRHRRGVARRGSHVQDAQVAARRAP